MNQCAVDTAKLKACCQLTAVQFSMCVFLRELVLHSEMMMDDEYDRGQDGKTSNYTKRLSIVALAIIVKPVNPVKFKPLTLQRKHMFIWSHPKSD